MGGVGPAPSHFYNSIPTNAAKVVFLRSEIREGDYQLFVEVVNSAKPDVIVLDSPGGLIEEAILIADEIRVRGLNTFIYGNRA
jgi:hypothetical protein